jgi:aminoglycoside 6'-N-acetyltransferase
MRYTFRPATRADLPMLRTWLATPEVVRWWGDPAEQYALLEEDLGNPLMVMRIVACEGRPFAYVQDYDVHTWPQAHFAHLPDGARGIDAFIGVPGMIARGHGAAFLRERAEQLISHQPEKCICAADVSGGAPLAVFGSADARKIAGAPVVAIDPDTANLRARRACAKAGFAGDEVTATEAGPIVVMVFGG